MQQSNSEHKQKKFLEWNLVHLILDLLGSSLELEQILNKTADLIVEMTDADDAGIYILNEAGNELKLVAHKNLHDKFYKNIKIIKVGDGLTGTAVGTGEPQWYSAKRGLHRRSPVTKLSAFSAIGSVPIIYRGKIFGAINVGIYDMHEFSRDEINLLNAIGAQLGAVIENARLYNEVIESEERYHHLLDATADGYVVLYDRKIAFADEKLIRWIEAKGYQPKEIIDKQFMEFVAPEEQAKIIDYYQQMPEITSMPVRYETVFLNKHGERTPVELGISLTKYQNETAIAVAVKDITERRRAEAALRESEERYRTILENTQEGYYEVDLSGNLIFFSDALCRILGYSRDELMGMNYRSYTVNECIGIVFKTFNQVYRTGIPVEGFSWEIFRKDGSKKYVEASISPLKNPAGEITGFRGFDRDITERRQAEKLIQDLMRSIGTVIYIVQEGKFQYINTLFQELTGYTEEELIGTSSLDLVHPEDRETVRKEAAKNLKGQDLMFYEYRLLKKDGDVIWVLEKVTSVEYRGKPAAIGSFIDITERKQMEINLQESEQRYSQLYEGINEAIVVLSLPELRVMHWNNKFVEIFNITQGQDLKSIDISNFVDAEDMKKLQVRLQKRLAGKSVSDLIELNIIDKECKARIIEAKTSLYKEKEHVVGIEVLIADITERKRAEQQLLMTNKLASVGELAAGVAHELNNPLTGIMGYAQLLAENKDIPEDIKPDLDRIYNESQRAAKIVKNLLSFARQGKSEKVYLDINDLIKITLDLRAYELKTSNIKVCTNLTPNPPLIRADHHQIQQVIMNLIINAEHAINETKRRGKLTIETSIAEDCIRISIADNGRGIPKESIDKIFDPFFTTKDVGIGTGLGLSICHGIIAEHGGTIYAESNRQGTTFIIKLKGITEVAATREEKQTEEEAIPYIEEKARKSILIVDDEPVICDVLSKFLSHSGHRVDAVHNAVDALQKMSKEDHNLYIIDIKMPQVSGIELYEIMKQRHPRFVAKIMFITGDTITAATQDFLNQTERPHLAKPFNFNKLVELVEVTLASA